MNNKIINIFKYKIFRKKRGQEVIKRIMVMILTFLIASLIIWLIVRAIF
tara:strand:- start:2504 stop:2650 length:147 start_codon:yes stop_codon:yes gene_type:complete